MEEEGQGGVSERDMTKGDWSERCNIAGFEVGGAWECRWPLKARKARQRISSEPPEGILPYQHLDFLAQ